jgi:thiol-disulfide isomerase/thioredoxin
MSEANVDSRNILIIVSAENCGACKYYKENKHFETIKEKLAKDGIVRFEHIEIKKMGDSLDKKYPEILSKWLRFYPIFILINGKDWNNGMKDIDEKNPNIEIFNARITDGVVTPLGNSIGMGPDKIPDWVKTNVSDNSKFKTSVIITSKLPSLANKDKSVPQIEKPKYIPTCGAVKILASSRR